MVNEAVARRRTKLVVAVLAVLVGYPLVLVVLGYALAGHAAETVRDRLALSLDGDARVGSVDLGLLRGRLVVDDVVVERHHRGTLRLAIEHIEVDVAPLGAVVVARDPRRVFVRGAHIAISGAGALDLPQREHTVITLGALEVVDSDLAIMVTTAWPELGQVRLVLERFRAGRTVLRTPLSWVFALEALDARVELPGDADFALRYADGRLSAVGGVFGDAPVEIAIQLPRTPGPDEPAQLRALAFELGKRLVIERGKRWLGRRLLFGR